MSPGASVPSARLEQEAHRLGLAERDLAAWAIGSPQQMQM